MKFLSEIGNVILIPITMNTKQFLDTSGLFYNSIPFWDPTV